MLLLALEFRVGTWSRGGSRGVGVSKRGSTCHARTVPTASRDRARPLVFVSRSLADADAQWLVDRLAEEYVLSETAGRSSRLPRSLSVRDAVRLADVAVAFLPSPDDPAWGTVFFEVGAAVAVGLPVVLVGDSEGVPSALAGLQRVDPGDGQSLANAISLLSRRRPRRQAGQARGRRDEEQPSEVLVMPEKLPEGAGSSALERWLRDVLAHAGARVAFAESKPLADRPDMTIWHDGLQATLGLPLPVEVLAAHSPARLPALLPRLRRTLRASGAQSLLAVYSGASHRPARWTDGLETVLFISSDELVDELSRAPLPDALSALLARAEPVME